MNQNLDSGLQISKSNIDRIGCFAAVTFQKDQQIAEYVGERISLAEGERRRRASRKKRICDVDLNWAIDGSRGGNGTQYVNHSCEPNSYLLISQGRVFLYAVREILPGEEITMDYLYELRLEGKQCRCRTASCVEAMAPSDILLESTSQTSGKRLDRILTED